jgi:D-alanyl-D-alanine carboxypeptidase
MSHRTRISISLIVWIIVWLLPFFASTDNKQKEPNTDPIIHNSITYTTGRIERETSTDDIIINIFESPQFLWSYTIVPTTPNSASVYDTGTDASITKYVSRVIPLNTIEYTPSDLVSIQSKYLTTSSQKLQLRQEAAENLIDMAKEFHDIFDKKLVIVSAYRSYTYQANLRKKWCADTLCAPAGHSEHQLGLAVDLFAATTADKFLSKVDFRKYYDWLAANAHRYGWHNTYQKWVDIDTYQIEPRHWRYLWRDLATKLFEQKMTFGEWIKL